jgi:hypothetical protein
MNRAFVCHRDLAKVVPVALMVACGKEARLPIVATLHNVLRNSGKVESGLPGHDGRPFQETVKMTRTQGSRLSEIAPAA